MAMSYSMSLLGRSRNLHAIHSEVQSAKVSVRFDVLRAIESKVGHRLRRETGDQRYWSPLDRREISMTQAIIRSCYVPFGKNILVCICCCANNVIIRAADVG